MNLFLQSHQQLIECLSHNKVDFIIVGGYAVIYYGYHRTTGGIDLWIKPSQDNKFKVLNALRDFGVKSPSLELLFSVDFEKHLVFSLGTEPEKVKFLNSISGVRYDDAAQLKVEVNIGSIVFPFLHLDQLIVSKQSTNRLKDQADVEELQKILQSKQGAKD